MKYFGLLSVYLFSYGFISLIWGATGFKQYQNLEGSLLSLQSHTAQLQQDVQDLVLKIDTLQTNQSIQKVNAAKLGYYPKNTKVIYFSGDPRSLTISSHVGNVIAPVVMESISPHFAVIPSLFFLFLAFFYVKFMEFYVRRKE